jgi:hypothetical protein
LSRVLYQRQEQRMKQRELEIQQAKLREQRLLKTAARSRALRQSRKDHASSPEKNEEKGNNSLMDFARNLETR